MKNLFTRTAALAMALTAAFLFGGMPANAADPSSLPSGFDPNVERRVVALETRVANLEAAAAKLGVRMPAVSVQPPLVASTTAPAVCDRYGNCTEGTCSGGSCSGGFGTISNGAGNAFSGGRPRLFGRWR